jgi:hypothetical protein
MHASQRAQQHRALIADLVVSGLFMLFGLYVVVSSVTEYDLVDRGQVGPGLLPLMIGLTLILTSGLIMLRLRGGPLVEAHTELPNLREAGRALALLVLILVTVIMMPIVGAIVSLGLFGLIETMVLERRGWRLGMLTALLIPALLYVFFEVVLGVPLPRGELGLL